ncbi:hypothetical protein SAMN03159338_1341 [Sphingomonas sp. NFR04]|uniref:hypothetical protein n=1 Tax=Sphingomonas sp. NFR04 TaxID=1566283 RepID=UPI0008E55C4A|nr:hypothetical protein [Sphingomonas sp. NFR04]SFJ30150.1 hypothetical protein SAMN03159338_1341 [Sphingomonas sp. NFR04]
MPRRKRLLLVAGAVALVVAIARPSPPRADFELLMHRVGDTAPQQVHAAVDLGVLAISVLVTWSGGIAH